MRRYDHTGGDSLFIIMATIYIGVLLLFASQTWFFVNWLFPGSQILMKLLTVLCFDIMAFLWACVDLFYRFASRGAKTVVRFAWAISFLLSLLASIFYLILESMLRFNVEITEDMINIGYGVTIISVSLTVIFVTWFLYLEWSVRHPLELDYSPASVRIQEIEEDIPQPQTQTRPMLALPSLPSLPKFWKKADPDPVLTDELIQQLRVLIRETVTAEQPKKIETEDIPPSAAAASGSGSPGRLSRAKAYAKKWAKWEATGFDHTQCPWKNPYEFKKRRPEEDLLIEARRLLGSESEIEKN